jgi:hypothetical protein
MSWNIKFFTDQNFTTISRTDSLSAQHLVDVIRVVNPDILVVIEVRSGNTGGVGRLISNTGGAAGVLQLQALLGAGWYVVPPQVLNEDQAPLQVTTTNYFEGIAVFFKGASLDFIGPTLWTGQMPADRATVNPANIAAYGGAWANALPAAAPAALGYTGGGVVAGQNQFAGQPFMRDASNALLEFPAAWARNPWYTAFWDKVNNRAIKLVSVHLPPPGKREREALKRLGDIANVSAQITVADNTGVEVICGDFNVNIQNANHSALYQTANLVNYTPLFGAGGNRATLVRRAKAAATAPFLRTPVNWWRLDKQGNYTVFDNFLVRYYGGGGPAAAQAVFDWVQIPKPNASPPNANAYMATPLNQIATDLQFVNKFNFGKIRNTSDHLAIAADI